MVHRAPPTSTKVQLVSGVFGADRGGSCARLVRGCATTSFPPERQYPFQYRRLGVLFPTHLLPLKIS
jgi:hypothetical protein